MKKSSRSTETSSPRQRPPLERMLRIHESLQSGQRPNCTQLAKALEVSTRSIQRDLDFMRDRLGLPIEYDPTRFGFFYTEAVAAFPTVQVTEGELFALLVAEKALQQYRGTPFEKPLLNALRKMAAGLPETISLHLADWDQAISFRTSVEPRLNLELIDALAQAIAARQQIQFVYRKPGEKQGTARTLDPYHLANINGDWFLFGFDHLRGEIRTFSPTRIQQLARTGKTFLRPRGFSVEQRLRDSFGVHSGTETLRVRLKFDAAVADYIREKTWHPSQELVDQPDGTVDLSLRLSSLVEIERWILGWGGHVRVIAPPQLVERIQAAATAILQRYDRPV